jgi:predicted thioesterase
MQPGLTGEARLVVGPQHLAPAYGSGAINVFGTPGMIALMEHAACVAIEPYLAVGSTSVGTRLEVRHLAATLAGQEVRAHAELVTVDGRRLEFEVTAYDQVEKIGEGRHERVVVDAERFLARAAGKGS